MNIRAEEKVREAMPQSIRFKFAETGRSVPGLSLPETGDAGTTIYILGGFTLMTTSLIYGFKMRRKKRKEEEV